MKKTMKKSDWVILRLLRKIITSRDSAAIVGDMEVRRSLQYLIDKYGDRIVDECVNALAEEESKRRAAFLFVPPVSPKTSYFTPPKSLDRATQLREQKEKSK
jgi:hypothetical protein